MIIEKIIRFFKRIKRENEYKKNLENHQQDILKAYFEMVTCPDLAWIMEEPAMKDELWYRALDHDKDKWDKDTFNAYRKHFYPIDKQEKIESLEEYRAAARKHLKTNDHHWQHRKNDPDGELNFETQLACLENIMDWLARGYEFKNRPYEFYRMVREDIQLPLTQRIFMEKCIFEGIDKKLIEERNKHQHEEEYWY